MPIRTCLAVVTMGVAWTVPRHTVLPPAGHSGWVGTYPQAHGAGGGRGIQRRNKRSLFGILQARWTRFLARWDQEGHACIDTP
jgi:hypothetical protein